MRTESGEQRKSQGHRSGYEQRDANAKWIFAIVAVLFVIGMLMHLVLAGVQKRLAKKPSSRDQLTGLTSQQPPTTELQSYPRLQIAPQQEMQAFRAREEQELNTYGWINRTAGVVRIPIERAMQLMVERSIPSRSEGRDQLGPSSYELQLNKATNTGGAK